MFRATTSIHNNFGPLIEPGDLVSLEAASSIPGCPRFCLRPVGKQGIRVVNAEELADWLRDGSLVAVKAESFCHISEKTCSAGVLYARWGGSSTEHDLIAFFGSLPREAVTSAMRALGGVPQFEGDCWNWRMPDGRLVRIRARDAMWPAGSDIASRLTTLVVEDKS